MKKEYEEIIKLIKIQYDITCDYKLIKVKQIEQYPHMLIIEFPEFNFIVKMVNQNRLHCKDINILYYDLSDNKFIEIPKKNVNGTYSINYQNNILLVYKELSEINCIPNAEWWAESLNSIHSKQVNQNYLNSFRTDIYKETLKLLHQADKYIDYSLKKDIYKILENVDNKFLMPRTNLVLSHNDPYYLNVMHNQNIFKLIDTDGMGLSPKEYDIQKLIYNHAIMSKEINDVESFFNCFCTTYEQKSGKKIDYELLKKLYSCDFIRSLSWLFIVSNDKSRADYKRQNKRLFLYKDSVKNGIHLKILKKI